MKVVFLETVTRIAKKNDVKEVSAGYAANFLFPKKLAVTATKEELAKLSLRKASIEAEVKIQNDLLEKNIQTLKEAKVTLSFKANEEGHLYAKVSADEIIVALKSQAHIDLSPEFLDLKDPIKTVGEHTITVQSGNKKGSFTLIIEALA